MSQIYREIESEFRTILCKTPLFQCPLLEIFDVYKSLREPTEKGTFAVQPGVPGTPGRPESSQNVLRLL